MSMLRIFTILDKHDINYWYDDIYRFNKKINKKIHIESIKKLLKINSSENAIGFYKIDVLICPEFIELKCPKELHMYLFKSRQITIIFIIDEIVSNSAIINICNKIDRLELSYDKIKNDFDKLILDEPINKIKNELELTKEIMIENIGLVLNRGEKIEILLDKSISLNDQSNLFFKKAKKLNSCC
jgi:hypothetical protein